jgi:putative tryptophan/tyrosine transport system substrate-binding protein
LLRKLGFTEGQNLIIEHRRMDEGAPKAFAGAAELVRSNIDVLVAFGPELALKAAVAAGQTVPIVMIAVNFDPMAGGYVSDITRPERNITGVVFRAPELAAKQVGLLVEAFPDAKPIAALWEQASAEQFDAAEHAAQSMHIELRSYKVENLPFDFDAPSRRAASLTGNRCFRAALLRSIPMRSADRTKISCRSIFKSLASPTDGARRERG